MVIRQSLLKEQSELALVKLLLQFPEVVENAAMTLEPHKVPTFLGEVAAAFHHFYHDHRVVIPEKDLSLARLALCSMTKTVLANGLKILGISAPEKM